MSLEDKLFAAIAADDMDAVVALVEAGADLNKKKEFPNKEAMTPLQYAVSFNATRVRIVNKLIRLGAPTDGVPLTYELSFTVVPGMKRNRVGVGISQWRKDYPISADELKPKQQLQTQKNTDKSATPVAPSAPQAARATAAAGTSRDALQRPKPQVSVEVVGGKPNIHSEKPSPATMLARDTKPGTVKEGIAKFQLEKPTPGTPISQDIPKPASVKEIASKFQSEKPISVAKDIVAQQAEVILKDASKKPVASTGAGSAEAVASIRSKFEDPKTDNVTSRLSQKTPQIESRKRPLSQKQQLLKILKILFEQNTTSHSVLQMEQELQLQASMYGMTVQNVPGDGNCFFHAVAEQLWIRTRKKSSHEALREQAVAYMVEHQNDFRDFIAGLEQNPEAYIQRMFQEGEWADEPVIVALARSLNVMIVIVRSDGAAPTVINPTATGAQLYLGYDVGLHYVSLQGQPTANMDTAVAERNPHHAKASQTVSGHLTESPNLTQDPKIKPPVAPRPKIQETPPVLTDASDITALSQYVMTLRQQKLADLERRRQELLQKQAKSQRQGAAIQKSQIDNTAQKQALLRHKEELEEKEARLKNTLQGLNQLLANTLGSQSSKRGWDEKTFEEQLEKFLNGTQLAALRETTAKEFAVKKELLGQSHSDTQLQELQRREMIFKDAISSLEEDIKSLERRLAEQQFEQSKLDAQITRHKRVIQTCDQEIANKSQEKASAASGAGNSSAEIAALETRRTGELAELSKAEAQLQRDMANAQGKVKQAEDVLSALKRQRQQVEQQCEARLNLLRKLSGLVISKQASERHIEEQKDFDLRFPTNSFSDMIRTGEVQSIAKYNKEIAELEVLLQESNCYTFKTPEEREAYYRHYVKLKPEKVKILSGCNPRIREHTLYTHKMFTEMDARIGRSQAELESLRRPSDLKKKFEETHLSKEAIHARYNQQINEIRSGSQTLRNQVTTLDIKIAELQHNKALQQSKPEIESAIQKTGGTLKLNRDNLKQMRQQLITCSEQKKQLSSASPQASHAQPPSIPVQTTQKNLSALTAAQKGLKETEKELAEVQQQLLAVSTELNTLAAAEKADWMTEASVQPQLASEALALQSELTQIEQDKKQVVRETQGLLEAVLLSQDQILSGYELPEDFTPVQRFVVALLQGIFQKYPSYDFLELSNLSLPAHWYTMVDCILDYPKVRAIQTLDAKSANDIIEAIHTEYQHAQVKLNVTLCQNKQKSSLGSTDPKARAITIYQNEEGFWVIASGQMIQATDKTYTPRVQAVKLLTALKLQEGLLAPFLLQRVRVCCQAINAASVEELQDMLDSETELLQTFSHFTQFYTQMAESSDKTAEYLIGLKIFERLARFESEGIWSEAECTEKFAQFRHGYLDQLRAVIQQEFLKRRDATQRLLDQDPLKRVELKIQAKQTALKNAQEEFKKQEQEILAEEKKLTKLIEDQKQLRQSYDTQLKKVTAEIEQLQKRERGAKQETLRIDQAVERSLAGMEKNLQQRGQRSQQLKELDAQKKQLTAQHEQAEQALLRSRQALNELESRKAGLRIQQQDIETRKTEESRHREIIIAFNQFVEQLQQIVGANSQLFLNKRQEIVSKIRGFSESGNNEFRALYHYLILLPGLSALKSNKLEENFNQAGQYFHECLDILKAVFQDARAKPTHDGFFYEGLQVSFSECEQAIRKEVDEQLNTLGLKLDAQGRLIAIDKFPLPIEKLIKANQAFGKLIQEYIQTHYRPVKAAPGSVPKWKEMEETTGEQAKQIIEVAQLRFEDVVSCFVPKVKVIAGQQLHVEQDINLPGVDVTLVSNGNIYLAPHCTIDTSGKAARKCNYEKARDGWEYRSTGQRFEEGSEEDAEYAEGKNGEDGLHGLDGHQAGHIFIGAKGKIENLGTLTCVANGGEGTNGQEGGTGDRGRKGKNTDPAIPDPFPGERGWTTGKTNRGIILAFPRIPGVKVDGSIDKTEQSGAGGQGGKFGKGGKGGQAGNITVEEGQQNRLSRVKQIKQNRGVDGADAKGGLGGNAGIAGYLGMAGYRTRSPKKWAGIVSGWRTSELHQGNWDELEFREKFAGRFDEPSPRGSSHYSRQYYVYGRDDYNPKQEQQLKRSTDKRSVSEENYSDVRNTTASQEYNQKETQRRDKTQEQSARQSLYQQAQQLSEIASVTTSKARSDQAITASDENMMALNNQQMSCQMSAQQNEQHIATAVVTVQQCAVAEEQAKQATQALTEQIYAMEQQQAQSATALREAMGRHHALTERQQVAKRAAELAGVDVAAAESVQAQLTQAQTQLQQMLALRQHHVEEHLSAVHAVQDKRAHLIATQQQELAQLRREHERVSQQQQRGKRQEQLYDEALVRISSTHQEVVTFKEHYAAEIAIEPEAIASQAIARPKCRAVITPSSALAATDFSTQLVDLFKAVKGREDHQFLSKLPDLLRVGRPLLPAEAVELWSGLYSITKAIQGSQSNAVIQELSLMVFEKTKAMTVEFVDQLPSEVTGSVLKNLTTRLGELFYPADKTGHDLCQELLFKKHFFATFFSKLSSEEEKIRLLYVLERFPAAYHCGQQEVSVVKEALAKVANALGIADGSKDVDVLYFQITSWVMDKQFERNVRHMAASTVVFTALPYVKTVLAALKALSSDAFAPDHLVNRLSALLRLEYHEAVVQYGVSVLALLRDKPADFLKKIEQLFAQEIDTTLCPVEKLVPLLLDHATDEEGSCLVNSTKQAMDLLQASQQWNSKNPALKKAAQQFLIDRISLRELAPEKGTDFVTLLSSYHQESPSDSFTRILQLYFIQWRERLRSSKPEVQEVLAKMMQFLWLDRDYFSIEVQWKQFQKILRTVEKYQDSAEPKELMEAHQMLMDQHKMKLLEQLSLPQKVNNRYYAMVLEKLTNPTLSKEQRTSYFQKYLTYLHQDQEAAIDIKALEQQVNETREQAMQCPDNEQFGQWLVTLEHIDQYIDQHYIKQLQKHIAVLWRTVIKELSSSLERSQCESALHTLRTECLTELQELLDLQQGNFGSHARVFISEITAALTQEKLKASPKAVVNQVKAILDDHKKRLSQRFTIAGDLIAYFQRSFSQLLITRPVRETRKLFAALYARLVTCEFTPQALSDLVELCLKTQGIHKELDFYFNRIYGVVAARYLQHIKQHCGQNERLHPLIPCFTQLAEAMNAKPKETLLALHRLFVASQKTGVINWDNIINGVLTEAQKSSATLIGVFDRLMDSILSEQTISTENVQQLSLLSGLNTFSSKESKQQLLERNVVKFINQYEKGTLFLALQPLLMNLLMDACQFYISTTIPSKALANRLRLLVQRAAQEARTEGSDLKTIIRRLKRLYNYLEKPNVAEMGAFIKTYFSGMSPPEQQWLCEGLLTKQEEPFFGRLEPGVRDQILQNNTPEDWLPEFRKAYWLQEICGKLFANDISSLGLTPSEIIKSTFNQFLQEDNIQKMENLYAQLQGQIQSLDKSKQVACRQAIETIHECKLQLNITSSIARVDHTESQWLGMMDGLIRQRQNGLPLDAVNRILQVTQYVSNIERLINLLHKEPAARVLHEILLYFVHVALAEKVCPDPEVTVSYHVLEDPAFNQQTGLRFLEIFAKAWYVRGAQQTIGAKQCMALLQDLMEVQVYRDPALVEVLATCRITEWESVIKRKKIAVTLGLDMADPKHQHLLEQMIALKKISEEIYQQWMRLILSKPKVEIDVLAKISVYFIRQEWAFEQAVLAQIKDKPMSQWYDTLSGYFKAKKEADKKERSASQLVQVMRENRSINAGISALLPALGSSGEESELVKIVNDIRRYYEQNFLKLKDPEAVVKIKQEVAKIKERNKGVQGFLQTGNRQDIITFMALMIRAVQLTEGKDYIVRDTQLIALVCFLTGLDQPKGRLGRILTGEGKTLIMRMLAIACALRGERVDVLTSSRALAEPQAKEAEKLFALFDLKVSNNCDQECENNEVTRQKRYEENQVIYGEVGAFQRDLLLTNFFGKKIRPPELQSRRLLVDEVDKMFIDDADKVLYISHNIHDLEHLRWTLEFIWRAVYAPDVQEYSEHNVEQIFEAFKRNKEIIKAPSYLEAFIERRFSGWVKNAYLAKSMSAEREYSIIEKGQYANQAVINDLPTGVEQFNSQWSNGLHQFIQLKHLKPISNESLRAIFIANVNFFKRYEGRLYGVTGTLGSEAELSLLSEIYQVDFFNLPPFKKKQYQSKSCRKLQSEAEPGLVFCSIKDWSEAICDEVQTVTDSKVPAHPTSSQSPWLSKIATLEEEIKTAEAKKSKAIVEEVTLTKTAKKCEQQELILHREDEDGIVYALSPEEHQQKVAEYEQAKEKLSACQKNIATLGDTIQIKQKERDRCMMLQQDHEAETSGTKARAVLLICEDKKTAQTFSEMLRRKLSNHKGHFYLYDSYLEDFNIVQVQPGDIIVATNIAGRGTDLEISKILERNHGLHVILTYMPSNIRIEQQTFGRTARKGQPGSGCFIVYDERTGITIEQLSEERDQNEAKRIEDIRRIKIPRLTLEQKLFDAYASLQEQVEKHLKDREVANPIRQFQMTSLLNSWAFWLDEQDQKIEAFCNQGKSEEFPAFAQEMLNLFEVFKAEILRRLDVNRDMLVVEPAELLRLGRHYMQIDCHKDAIRCFDQVIELNPEFCGFAYYYRAESILAVNHSSSESKKQARTSLKQAVAHFEAALSRLSAANDVIHVISEGIRKTGEGLSADLYTKTNIDEMKVIQIHLSAARDALGRELTAESFKVGTIVQEESKQVFENLRRSEGLKDHIKDYRISKKAKVVDGELYYNDQKVALPEAFLQDKADILNYFRERSGAHKPHSERRIDLKHLEQYVFTRQKVLELIKDHIETVRWITPDASIQEKIMGDRFAKMSEFAGRGESIRTLLQSYLGGTEADFEQQLQRIPGINAEEAYKKLISEKIILLDPETRYQFKGGARQTIENYRKEIRVRTGSEIAVEIDQLLQQHRRERSPILPEPAEKVCAFLKTHVGQGLTRKEFELAGIKISQEDWETLYTTLHSYHLMENRLLEKLGIKLTDDRHRRQVEEAILVYSNPKKYKSFKEADLQLPESATEEVSKLWSQLKTARVVKNPTVFFEKITTDEGEINQEINNITAAIRRAVNQLAKGMPRLENEADTKKREIKIDSLQDAVIEVLTNAIGTIRTLPEIDLKNRDLAEFFKDETNLPPIVMHYLGIACAEVINLVKKEKEKSWWDWDAFACAMIGVAQIVAGVLIKAFCPPLAYLGKVLISEGIGDIMFAIQSAIAGNFSWEAYAEHKIQSLAISLLTAGIGASEGGEIFKEATKEATKAATQTAAAHIGSIIVKDVLAPFAIGVAQVAIDVGINMSLSVVGEHIIEAIFNEFKETFKDSVRAQAAGFISTIKNQLKDLYQRLGRDEGNQVLASAVQGLSLQKMIDTNIACTIRQGMQRVASALSGMKKQGGIAGALGQAADIINRILTVGGHHEALAQIISTSGNLFSRLSEVLDAQLSGLTAKANDKHTNQDALITKIDKKVDKEIVEKILNQIQTQVQALFSQVGNTALKWGLEPIIEQAQEDLTKSIHDLWNSHFPIPEGRSADQAVQTGISRPSNKATENASDLPPEQPVTAEDLENAGIHTVKTPDGDRPIEDLKAQQPKGQKLRFVMHEGQAKQCEPDFAGNETSPNVSESQDISSTETPKDYFERSRYSHVYERDELMSSERNRLIDLYERLQLQDPTKYTGNVYSEIFDPSSTLSNYSAAADHTPRNPVNNKTRWHLQNAALVFAIDHGRSDTNQIANQSTDFHQEIHRGAFQLSNEVSTIGRAPWALLRTVNVADIGNRVGESIGIKKLGDRVIGWTIKSFNSPEGPSAMPGWGIWVREKIDSIPDKVVNQFTREQPHIRILIPQSRATPLNLSCEIRNSSLPEASKPVVTPIYSARQQLQSQSKDDEFMCKADK